MATATYNDDNACFNNPVNVQIDDVAGATRFEWTVLDKPAGSQVILNGDGTANSDVDVSQDGPYTIRVCAYFDEGQTAVPAARSPTIGCPLGVIAGQPAMVTLSGCENGTVQWTSSGVATGIAGTLSGATMTTDATMPGTATAEVICTRFDINGNPITETLTCDTEVLPADTELVCTTSAPVEVEVIACGERCECVEFTIIFDCQKTTCSEINIPFVILDCPPCPDVDDDCPEMVLQELVSSQPATLAACTNLDCDECGAGRCCDDHRPVFLYDNVCDCPGWTFEAQAVDGSSFLNACNCNVGQQWCFEGPVTITGSGPAHFISALVIWGHNISSGQITTSPLQQFSGQPTGVGLIDSGTCADDYTQPVVISFADVTEAITEFTVTIEAEGLICIDQFFMGRKFFLPDDLLPPSFVNPHDGDDYELDVKESECGILSRSVKHLPCDWSIEICATEEWLCEEWRPFLRYAKRHGFYFQWSRNRKPSDIINAWITDKQQGSSVDEFGIATVTLNARGFITQPQTKFVA